MNRPIVSSIIEEMPGPERQDADLHALYDEVAKDWSRDIPQVRDDLITWPFLLEKIKELATAGVVLDAGCGTGNICRLVSPFVRTVMGLDISQNMLSEAERTSADTTNILYLRADMRKMSAVVAPQSVDLVLSIFGHCCLENQTDLADAFRETYNILRPGGHVILQIPHPSEPFFQSKSKWARELDTPKDYFDNGATLRRRLRMANGKWITVGRHHFTLTSYFDEILKSNLTIRQVLEPKPPIDILQKYPDLDHEAFLPSSLFIIAQK